MTVAFRPGLMSTEQLLALPDDGKERWLIRGELREKEMARRNYGHSRIEAKIAYLLHRWAQGQSGRRGVVVSGEAGIRLRRNPNTTVGIDVAYLPSQVADAKPDEDRFLDAVPVLAVEILSPSDKHQEITEGEGAQLLGRGREPGVGGGAALQDRDGIQGRRPATVV